MLWSKGWRAKSRQGLLCSMPFESSWPTSVQPERHTTWTAKHRGNLSEDSTYMTGRVPWCELLRLPWQVEFMVDGVVTLLGTVSKDSSVGCWCIWYCTKWKDILPLARLSTLRWRGGESLLEEKGSYLPSSMRLPGRMERMEGAHSRGSRRFRSLPDMFLRCDWLSVFFWLMSSVSVLGKNTLHHNFFASLCQIAPRVNR